MKVLMVVTEKLPVPPVRGGAIQTYIDAVAPLLAKQHDITVLCRTDPSLPERDRRDGVAYVRVPGGMLDIYRDNVVAFLRKNQFDLIHIFNRPRLVMPVRVAAPHARIILSMHNDMFESQKIDPEEGTRAVETVERIVTVSNYVGQRITELQPAAKGKLRTIYSGVDPARFLPTWADGARKVRDSLRHEHGLSGKKVILFVGRLSPKKGADILVRAMPELARTHPDAALVLVGSKWYGEDKVSDYVAYVRSLAARSPIPVVTTGFVTPDQVHHWFWVGDLFVCASQWEEPLARVHFEAMAAGLPIVTTARGGNPEVMSGAECGVVVGRPDQPGAMAEVLGMLLSNGSLRDRLGRAGRKLAESQYNWDRVAREISEVWASKGK
ncbi:MAG: lipopolysaccharide N-acetylglucosaminyltransferase [Firmicutes bacterium]|nr:lipopolysaccharide N-acetylglucosaminyltransferase [Bacillota bacterium]